MILALDPGIRGCGIALFSLDKRLIACDYVKNSYHTGNDANAVLGMANAVLGQGLRDRVKQFVFEHPRIYTVSKSKGDNNDLLPLVGIAYAVASQLQGQAGLFRVFPHEWKGTMTKDVCHARTRTRLDTAELLVLDAALTEAGSMGHNVLDAVGIGLHHVGRLAPKRAWE